MDERLTAAVYKRRIDDEKLYCARGEMENRIKECDQPADRGPARSALRYTGLRAAHAQHRQCRLNC
jgi:hypothetical protein